MATANKKWGYDEALVPNVECIHCGEKIGDAPYVLYASFARFGDMFFMHKLCLRKEDRVHRIEQP